MQKTTQQQVCEILQWDELQYGEFIYQSGLQYLREYIKDESEAIIDHIIRSRIFWNWWKMNWQYRDQAFVKSSPVKLQMKTCRAIYFELHDARTLAEEIYPNGAVLGESYNNMIAELNDHVNKSLCRV